MNYILLSTLLIVSIVLFKYFQVQKRKRLEEQKRIEEELRRKRELDELHNKQRKELLPFVSEIEEFNNIYNEFVNQSKFLSHLDIFNFRNENQGLLKKIKNKDYKHLPDFDYAINKIDSFISDFNNLEKLIQKRNQNFIATELKNTNNFLSDVEGKSLDNQQRTAIIIDEDNQLVIAGAGSGKTTTIAGKVKYLTQIQNINPNNILLISFTRKSAEEMQERIKEKMGINISVKTFHKLGLDIIAEANNEKPAIYDSAGKTHLEIIASFIKYSKNDETYFDLLMDFLSYYLKPYKDIDEFTSDAEHNNYLNEQKLEGYNLVEKKTKEGVIIKYRERFKSQEEVLIANFLFRNRIKYEYEEKYQYKTASKTFSQYKPDFYLPDYGIYIEHFGVDENWNVPDWFKGKDGKSAKQVYNEGIQWKRSEHETNGTTLIETYSWQQSKGILLSELKNKLLNQDVEFNPISNDDLWKYLEENTPEDIDVFTQLINTFLVLFKSNNEKILSLKKRAKSEENERAIFFLELFEPIYNNYESYLNEIGEIDFSDMINKATESVVSNSFISDFDYIIIDEFQDISLSRYHLIKSLIDQKPNTKLFCVGDDWQSIYRFAGSDIGIFTGFAEYFKSSTIPNFERKSQTSYIEYTYRFDNKLIELSSNFILKNPNQIEKSLKSHKHSNETPYTLYQYSDADRKGTYLYQALEKALIEINTKEKNLSTNILLIGRYDFERNNFENSFHLLQKTYNRSTNSYNYIYNENNLHTINFLTAHKSKGLEADYIIVLNGNSGTYGFPSEISDDPLLNFLLSKADQFPNGEERRLFYVAMTRAKKHVYFLSSHEYPSKFISEIEANETVTSLKCEWCDNGKLVERKGPYGYFYACNNNHYCNFTRKIEPDDFKNVAEEFDDKKDYENAIKYYEKYLEVSNGDSLLYYNLGRAYENANQPEKALTNYDKSIYLNNSYAYAYYWKGSVLYDLKKYREAIIEWNKFNSLKPNSNAIHYWLAHAYFKINNFGQAINSINKEIETNDDNANAIKLKTDLISILAKKFNSGEFKINSTQFEIFKEYIDIAINSELNIKFDYHKSEQFEGGIKSLRTIKPLGYKMVGNSQCLVGYCYMRNEERTFNVDRISNLIINPNKIEFWEEV